MRVCGGAGVYVCGCEGVWVCFFLLLLFSVGRPTRKFYSIHKIMKLI